MSIEVSHDTDFGARKGAPITTRRGFLKGAFATAGVAATVGAIGLAPVGLSGCSSQGSKIANTGNGATAGTFTATAEGYGGEITATLVVDNLELVSVDVVGDLETEGIGGRAVSLLPQRMLAHNTADVDAISGATVTSMAVINAAKAALSEGGVKLEARDVSVTQNMTPGTYQGEAYGKWKAGTVEGTRFFSPADIQPTRVEVTVDQNSIVSVEVLDTSETPGFFEPCIERIPAAVVDQQSLTVDAVTGCTMTTGAILSGVQQCLEQAGADLRGFVEPTEHVGGNEEITVDLAIVGSGGSGTMAALTALEGGKTVAIIEKCGKIGGLSACASSFLCVGSDLQIEAEQIYDIDEQYNYQMNFAHWKTNGPLVRNVLESSAGVVNKLSSLYQQTDCEGFEGVNIGRPCVRQRKGTDKIQALYDTFIIPQGGQLMLETAAESLIVEDGVVCGVNAVRQDTTTVTVHAKAVHVATGGFGGNKSMLKEICGSSNFYLNGVSRNTGDGIQMCREVGGHLDPEIIPEFSEYCGNDKIDIFSGYLKYLNQPGFLAVNPAGERFINEQMFMSSILENAGPALASVGYAYLVFTQGDVDAMVKDGILGVLSDENLHRLTLNEQQYSRVNHPGYPTLNEELENAINHNQAWKADTLAGLGDAIGLDSAVFGKTIEEYLASIASGQDVRQGKDPAMLHSLSDGPFYALRITPTIFGTLDGIKVSGNCQALDDEGRIIKGLYCGGQDSGGYFVSPYYSDAAGHSCGYAWISGYIAAKHFLENA
ncbi:FAD-binding protein [Eggerthellaceae bacterium 3-80]